jgi:hypothetical protein
MKMTSMFFAVVSAMMVYANSINDVCLSFSTKGPDCYADGTQVLDGECYALVWSSDGSFEGFDANGGCVDSNDKIVLVAPVAKDGKCPPILFQIPEDDVKILVNGRYSVYLLDTRVSVDGTIKPLASKDGKIAMLNGYGAVTASLKLDNSTTQSMMKEFDSFNQGKTASDVASMPLDCKQPKIKNMRIEGDNVYLTVENLKGYMRVQSGKEINASESTGAAVRTSGSAEDVILVAPKSGSSGFFKVIRN